MCEWLRSRGALQARAVRALFFAAVLVTGCAHRTPTPRVDARVEKWTQWQQRVEALPPCLPQEWEDAPQLESTAKFEPGQTVHVRGALSVLEVDCSQMFTEYRLQGRWLPPLDSEMTLAEIDDAVARSTRVTCGSFLGARVGRFELAIEDPLTPQRLWSENDALRFDELLAQIGVVVFGVIDASDREGRQSIVRVDRACRMPGPPLAQQRLAEGGPKLKLFDGLERLADDANVSRVSRAQALRVLVDVAFSRDPVRAEAAARRLATEFEDKVPLERVLEARSAESPRQ